VTAWTTQDTTGVSAVTPRDPLDVARELERLVADVAVDAVKIGMLGTEAVARVVAAALPARVPIVWDPVVAPSRGAVRLYDGDPRAAFALLAPVATVVTPNVDEAAILSGHAVTGLEDAERAARALVAAGARAALVKGGHLAGPRATDMLATADETHRIDGERIERGPVHGTGCVLSTALACQLATGQPLVAAATRAKAYLTAKLAAPIAVGGGARVLV
jgi:hydroxymethylpyrimidine/phosphomethylpyrimidine kinase